MSPTNSMIRKLRKLTKDQLHDILWIGGMAVVLAIAAWSLYAEKQKQWHIQAVLDGPIRANNKSRVFHVPTCPQYLSVSEDNLVQFYSVREAREAGYREALNCGDDVYIRELNENETAEPPEPGDAEFR